MACVLFPPEDGPPAALGPWTRSEPATADMAQGRGCDSRRCWTTVLADPVDCQPASQQPRTLTKNPFAQGHHVHNALEEVYNRS